MTLVVFACLHSAGRSQMAAAFFNRLAEPALRARSAGTAPAARVHPEVVQVMREEGIELADVQPTQLTPELAREASFLVTLGCGEACPHVPGLAREDWTIEDPKDRPLARVRAIRDEVRRRVEDLLARRPWSSGPLPAVTRDAPEEIAPPPIAAPERE